MHRSIIALGSGILLSCLSPALGNLVWTPCGDGVDCSTIEVPLEYGQLLLRENATIALSRYKATVEPSKRLGSILMNPGGPGAAGAGFVQVGAGAAVSVLSGGLYDIIGFDPRGVGNSTPVLECFRSAGAEFNFSQTYPTGPALYLGSFTNASETEKVREAITSYDSAVGALAQACVTQNSSALFTSTVAYVVRDMVAIVDAIDGPNAPVNFWGYSYGTIYFAEFVQTFPERVGRMIADGVFDAEAQASTYLDQLPFDQISVRDGLNDWISFCEAAGPTGCPWSTPPQGVTDSLTVRFDKIFKDLHYNPIPVYPGFSIGLETFSPLLDSFILVPSTWQTISFVLQGLEVRNASVLLGILEAIAPSPPSDPNAPGKGTLSSAVLLCVDSAPSSNVTIDQIIELTANVSVSENTPLLPGDLQFITFCHHFPDKRPLVPNLGISRISEADSALAAMNKTVLIVNGIHDVATPLVAAQRLRNFLSKSSRLAIRGGTGHTTISQASLGMAMTVYEYFTQGKLPVDGSFFPADQNVFPPLTEEPFPAGKATGLAAAPTFNGTDYTPLELSLLRATYDIGIAFLQ